MKTETIQCTPVSHGILRGDVLDGVVEQVVHAPSAAARAEILAELVREVCATIQWLHETQTAPDHQRGDELTSVAQLARIAQEHQRQMCAAGQMVPSWHRRS